MSGADQLAEAHAAVERGAWQLALDVLGDGGPVAGGAEGLELRAQAAYGNGEFEASVAAWEDLYSLHVDGGDRTKAARAAAMIAMYLMMDTGLMAPVRGWLRRAELLLEGHDECSAHAVIAMVRTYERFMCGDMVAARQQSALAIELGGRLGVVAGGRHRSGRRRPDQDLRRPRRRGPRAARRDRCVVDVRRGRPADDGDDVLRVDLCGAGTGTSRPGEGVDRGDGALASRRRGRRHQWSMSCPSRRAAADLRSVRSRRGRSAQGM